MTTRAPLDPRAEELLCQDALEGLDEAESRELAGLLGDRLDAERDSFARAVAGVDLAFRDPSEQLPEALQRRILDDAPQHLPAPAATQDAPPAPRAQVIPLPAPRSRFLPWLIAAACLAALLVVVLRPPPPTPAPQVVSVVVSVPVPPPAPPTPEEARSRLLAAGKKPIPWGGTKDPAAQGVEGDVVWDNARQEGYMRFRGLAANDPTRLQYQLWIFDKNQSDKYPIDGGVFDVASGETVVPITAKLKVQEPTLFAITIEKPGGVVVSSRERLVLAAKVPAG